MGSKAEVKLKAIVENFLKVDITNINSSKRLLEQFPVEEGGDGCSLEEFAVYFLTTLRKITEAFIITHDEETPAQQVTSNNGAVCTPENTTQKKQQRQKTPVSGTKSQSITKECAENMSNSFSCDDSITLSDAERSLSMQRTCTSTPLQPSKNQSHQRHSTTFSPHNNSSHTSQTQNTGNRICLGDFLTKSSSTPNNSRSNKKKTPQQQQQQQQQQQRPTDTPTSAGKPKKRVVPTKIISRSTGGCDASVFGVDSAFSAENNILQISHTELIDKDKCAIMAARKSLKVTANEISKELNVSSKPVVVTEPPAHTIKLATMPAVDLEQVTQRETLEHLATIYATLVNLNFTSNILNELSFILNLLNVKKSQQSFPIGSDDSATFKALHNPINCIYFSLSALSKLQHLLALLDTKSLGVVLSCERIALLPGALQSYLQGVYQHKHKLETQKPTADLLCFDNSMKNVYYQQEKDTRAQFSSNQDFGAFKTQRDLFYKALNLWESQHLHPAWQFSKAITPIINDIFRNSENVVNMAHFAELFVSQLLISASDTTSPTDIGLEIDQEKFSKLTQRLVAPSNFNAEYQFPRHQAFFRDFIIEARSFAFVEQLKVALYSQLISRNDSSFEQLKLLPFGEEHDDDEQITRNDHTELVVRPTVLASMIVLAKFLGFLVARPYNQHSDVAVVGHIEKQQIKLRSLVEPAFKTTQLLRDAIRQRKLLITLPWLVQYLSMLDNVTLQLEDLTETTKLLCELYTNIGTRKMQLQPTSEFIVRCCLGWLFETKPKITDQYYEYRGTLMNIKQKDEQKAEVKFLISTDFLKELTTKGPLFVSSLKRESDGSYICIVEQQQQQLKKLSTTSASSLSSYSSQVDIAQLNPMLESILNVGCPFLADFRVSIMPAKYALSKNVSRTGRYRHITTRIADTALPSRMLEYGSTEIANQTQPHTVQNKLLESFLHSQNPSMRRLIEFVIERAYKTVVKDAQHKILLPSKSGADAKVNEIESRNYKEIYEAVKSIYTTARKQAIEQWESSVPQMISDRITASLDALLPIETEPIIKQTYGLLIEDIVSQKVQRWQYLNVVKNNFYCSDMCDMAQKIRKANEKEKAPSQSSELKIVSDTPSMTELIRQLRYWAHCTSIRPELFTSIEDIIACIAQIPLTFVNTLPTSYYLGVGGFVVRLLQLIIANKPEHFSQELVLVFCDFLSTPQMLHLNTAGKSDNKSTTREEEEEVSCSSPESTRKAEKASNLPNIYDSIITVPFIISLRGRHLCFDRLRMLLVEMIRQQLISINFINERFLGIFKSEWPAAVLNEMSTLLQKIADEYEKFNVSTCSDDDDDDNGHKSKLLMEVLADFSRDVDNF